MLFTFTSQSLLKKTSEVFEQTKMRTDAADKVLLVDPKPIF